MDRRIFYDRFSTCTHHSPDVSPITSPENTPSRTFCCESNATNGTRSVSTSVTSTPSPTDDISGQESDGLENDYQLPAPAYTQNGIGFISQSGDHFEQEADCTYQEFANARFVRVGVIEHLDAIEKDQSPNERFRLRMYRAAPTQSFPKITTDRTEAVMKLSMEQRRDLYFRNVSSWVVSAKKDGVEFDVGNTMGDFDYAERAEQARQNIAVKMIRDDFGVWRLKSEVDEGVETITNRL